MSEFLRRANAAQKRVAELEAEVEKMRIDKGWSYGGLYRILGTELPLTMTLGLAAVLVKRMVLEGMFAEHDEVVTAVRSIVERTIYEAAKAAEGEE